MSSVSPIRDLPFAYTQTQITRGKLYGGYLGTDAMSIKSAELRYVRTGKFRTTKPSISQLKN